MSKLVDNVLFPFRALFVPEENRFGLTSLRNECFKIVAEHTKGKVLDVGCGRDNLFVKDYIGEKNGVGIDVFEYDGVVNVVKNLCELPYEDGSFDTVTLIAVGGHIPKHLRECEFKEFARILKKGGRLLMTEGEVFTQTIGHKWRHFSYALIGKKDMDSERGMEEEEEYCMPFKEINQYLNNYGYSLQNTKNSCGGLIIYIWRSKNKMYRNY